MFAIVYTTIIYQSDLINKSISLLVFAVNPCAFYVVPNLTNLISILFDKTRTNNCLGHTKTGVICIDVAFSYCRFQHTIEFFKKVLFT